MRAHAAYEQSKPAAPRRLAGTEHKYRGADFLSGRLMIDLGLKNTEHRVISTQLFAFV